MIIKCPTCGGNVVVNGLGRKRLNIPLKNVCEALQVYQNLKSAAKDLNCSPAYILNALKAKGLKLKDIIANGKSSNLPKG